MAARRVLARGDGASGHVFRTGCQFSRGMATAKRRVVVMGRACRVYDGHISLGNKICFGNKCAARAPAVSPVAG